MLLSTGEAVAFLLEKGFEVKEADLNYAVRARLISPPRLIGGRRLWNDDRIDALERLFIQRGKKGEVTEK